MRAPEGTLGQEKKRAAKDILGMADETRARAMGQSWGLHPLGKGKGNNPPVGVCSSFLFLTLTA